MLSKGCGCGSVAECQDPNGDSKANDSKKVGP